MMRFSCSLLFITCALYASSLGADQNQGATKIVTSDINVTYGPQSFGSITETANVAFYGTTVTGPVLINGDFNATNAQLGSLVVNGNATLTNCTVAGTVSVYGGIQMQNSQVNGTVSSYSQTLIFDNCKLGPLSIKYNPSQQTVQIRSGTVVNGGITFDSGSGIVLWFKGCYVTGPIVGGTYQMSK
jgi:cytoskeletal protein CcmA (bactofilin family)